jgi:hypothetical protein
VRRLSTSKEHRIRELLTLEMGDHKPSQFLQHLRNLAPDIPDDQLRRIWSSRLPSHIMAVFAGHPEGDFDIAARCKKSIIKAEPQPLLASLAPPPENNEPREYFEDLRCQMKDLHAELDRTLSKSGVPRSSSRNRRSDSRSSSRDNVTPTVCW